MAELPDVEDAYGELLFVVKQSHNRLGEETAGRVAVLNAAVQRATANTILQAAVDLRKTVNRSKKAVTESIDKSVAAQDRIVEAQLSIASETQRASSSLRDSIDAFTKASETSTTQLVKSSDLTAVWTKRMTIATYVLVFAAFVQAFAAVAQVIVALNMKPAAVVAPPTNTTSSRP